MPSTVLFDVFALPGVTPRYQHSITAGNRILANNHKAIGVTMRVAKVQTLADTHKGVGTTKNVTGGDIRSEGWRDERDWRYSQQQKDILSGLPEATQEPGEPSLVARAAGTAVSVATGLVGRVAGAGPAVTRALTPTNGALPLVWSEGMTQGGRLGEAVNPAVWDETYSGRSGVFMHNGAADYDAVLLHEVLHMVGLHHVAEADNVMHATMTSTTAQNKLTEDQKRTLQSASF